MMSACKAFAPFLRRTWTCRACLRSQQQPLQRQGLRLQRNPVAHGLDVRRTFATKADVVKEPIGKSSKRRRRLLIAGGGIVIGAAAVTINDDAKHAYIAAQRSYRVLGTLVLNIKEWVYTVSK